MSPALSRQAWTAAARESRVDRLGACFGGRLSFLTVFIRLSDTNPVALFQASSLAGALICKSGAILEEFSYRLSHAECGKGR